MSFIESISPIAVSEQKRTGVLASITIAQAILESNWGRSAPGKNLFGIKGTGQEQRTQEYVNGHFITVSQGFRVYNSWEGSVIDHSNFLVENGRYTSAGFFDASLSLNYRAAAYALQRAGYATDPEYAVKLIAIIEAFGLMKYDAEGVDEVNKVLEIEQWEWEEYSHWLEAAYNDGTIKDWFWVAKVHDRKLTYADLLRLKVLIDERRRIG